MQIDNNKVFSKWFQEVKETTNRTTKESAQIYPKNVAKDTINLSEDALDIHRFVTKLSQEEEIRYEKVDEIQRQIENGTYQVTAKDVVAKLLEGK